jgi:hypothetical protein
MKKENEVMVDAEYEEVVDNKEESIDINDVEHMIIAGRKKNGEPFFHTIGTTDLFLAKGIVEFAQTEIDYHLAKFVQDRNSK